MMSAADDLRVLLERQRTHDQACHRDIYYLSYPDRVRHLVLHFSKYVGRLALETSPDQATTLADTLVVSMSAAEPLRLDPVGHLLGEEAASERDLATAGSSLADALDAPSLGEPYPWLFRRLAQATGRMAKSCESLDHMEAFDYRAELSAGVVEAFQVTLAAASRVSQDPVSLIETRWKAIEDQEVF